MLVETPPYMRGKGIEVATVTVNILFFVLFTKFYVHAHKLQGFWLTFIYYQIKSKTNKNKNEHYLKNEKCKSQSFWKDTKNYNVSFLVHSWILFSSFPILSLLSMITPLKFLSIYLSMIEYHLKFQCIILNLYNILGMWRFSLFYNIIPIFFPSLWSLLVSSTNFSSSLHFCCPWNSDDYSLLCTLHKLLEHTSFKSN